MLNDINWKDVSVRQELFNRYVKWRVLSHDLDHIHYMTYLTRNYTREQKMWFSLCFGFCYRTPQAFSFTETFPDILNIPQHEIEEWNNANYSRQSYGTDRRYAKGKFAKQVLSMKEWLEGKTLEQKIDNICSSNDGKENFKKLYSEIGKIYYTGRMGGWLTLQALHDLCNLNIDPHEILLEGYHPNGDSSLGSIWNGLCTLTQNEHKMVGGKYGNYSCNEEDIIWGREKLMYFAEEAAKYSGFRVDSFRIESFYCQWKRCWGENGSKEFPGHASSDAVSRYAYFKKFWPEIDLSNFREAIRDQPGLVKGVVLPSYADELFGETGEMLNLHELFPDMKNLHKIKNIDLNKFLVKEIWEDDGLEPPIINIEESSWSEDIKTTPKYYTLI